MYMCVYVTVVFPFFDNQFIVDTIVGGMCEQVKLDCKQFSPMCDQGSSVYLLLQMS